jgi:uncharacterized protein YndB with AHSA1/START domain
MGNRRMRRSFGAGLSLFVALAAVGCGDSLDKLNGLSAAGAIHEDAPIAAHVQIQISAPPERVWAILIDAPSWPKWGTQIDSVDASGPLAIGSRFEWKSGGMSIHSEVHLFDPEHRLSWTGTAMTAKAVHVWELEPSPGGGTTVTVKESMEGLLMKRLYSSGKLAEADSEWLAALKREAEKKPQ